MLFQFGDAKDTASFLNTPYPLVVISRLASDVYRTRFGNNNDTTNNNNNNNNDNNHGNHTNVHPPHHPPILGLLSVHRHYDHFEEVDRLWDTIPWSSKKSSLIWRGATSGTRDQMVQNYFDYDPPEDINVAFTYIVGADAETETGRRRRDHLQKYIRDSRNLAPRQLLSYKYLLSLEGWGLASGLKWMLYSNSVVFMAPPRKVSWAMEDKLVPYVHYIPLQADFSNVPEQLAWARAHDDECRTISLQARAYMEDLVTSDLAQRANRAIFREIGRIYQQQFGSVLQSCHNNQSNKTKGG
jgi:hypothetical protein